MAFCHTVLNCCTWRLLLFESRGPEWWTSSNIHHPRLLFIPTLYPRSPNPIITVYPYSLLCFYPKFLKPTKLLILISLSLWLHSGASSSLRCKSSSSLHLDSLSTFLNLTPNPHSLSYPFFLPTMQILIHTHPHFHLTHHPHTSSSLTLISNHHSPSDLVLNSSPLLKLSQQKLWYSFTHPHHFDLESSSSLYLKSFWFHHSLLSTFSHLPHSYPTSLSSLHCLFILIYSHFRYIFHPQSSHLWISSLTLSFISLVLLILTWLITSPWLFTSLSKTPDPHLNPNHSAVLKNKIPHPHFILTLHQYSHSVKFVILTFHLHHLSSHFIFSQTLCTYMGKPFSLIFSLLNENSSKFLHLSFLCSPNSSF